jgi:hypothetical protein
MREHLESDHNLNLSDGKSAAKTLNRSLNSNINKVNQLAETKLNSTTLTDDSKTATRKRRRSRRNNKEDLIQDQSVKTQLDQEDKDETRLEIEEETGEKFVETESLESTKKLNGTGKEKPSSTNEDPTRSDEKDLVEEKVVCNLSTLDAYDFEKQELNNSSKLTSNLPVSKLKGILIEWFVIWPIYRNSIIFF